MSTNISRVDPGCLGGSWQHKKMQEAETERQKTPSARVGDRTYSRGVEPR